MLAVSDDDVAAARDAPAVAGHRGRRLPWGLPLAAAAAVASVIARAGFVERTTVYTVDSYYYLGTAQSLLDSLSYSFRGTPHTRFLPLYPMATAAAGAVVGVERAGRWVPVLAWAGVVVLTYLIGRRLLSVPAGVVAATLLVLQPIAVKWTSIPMSESVFTLLLAGSMYAGVVAFQDGTRWLWPVAGALGGLSMLGRYEGAAALAVLGALALLRPRPRAWRPVLLGLVLFVAVPLVWAVRGLLVDAPNQSYADEFIGGLRCTGAACAPLLTTLGRRLRYFGLDGWLNPWFAVGAWAGVAVCLARRRWRVAGLVAGAWLALFVLGHLAWYYVYERFLVPAVPAAALLAAALLVGAAEALVGLARRARVPRVGAVAVAAVLVAAAVGAVAGADWRRAQALTDRHIAELSDDWGGTVAKMAAIEAGDRLGPGEAVATDAGALVAYYAGARTLYLPFKEYQTVDVPDLNGSGPALLAELRQQRVRFLVVQVLPGQTGLQPFGLSGPALVARYAGRLGPDGGHDVVVEVYEVPRE